MLKIRRGRAMEEFNTEAFNNFLVRRINDKQKEPMTEFNQGAIAELFHVQEMLSSMLKNNIEQEPEAEVEDEFWEEIK